MKWLDCHTHTEWSDGRQSVEQVLECARQQFVWVGISDHASTTDYLNSSQRIKAYCDFLTQYPVARGVEMDLGRSFKISDEVRHCLDYVIGSVHGLSFNGRWISFQPLILFLKKQNTQYHPEEEIDHWDDFFRMHLTLLRQEYQLQPFDILGHGSLLPPLALDVPEAVFPEWWEDELIELLQEFHIAMELSNRWRTPYPRLMRKAVQASVQFSLGSDGHDPAKTSVLDYPRELIRNFAVPDSRIFTIPRLLT